MFNCEGRKLNNKILIITNNTEVERLYKDRFPIKLNEGSYYDVLLEVRNFLHQGYELITHPLMGSVKPNETPYRSIIIKQASGIDLQSVEIIESSIQTYEKFERMQKSPKWSQRILEDFQFVDLRLFESSLDSFSLYT